MRHEITLTLVIFLLLAPFGFAQSDPFDIIIAGAHIVDGSGNPCNQSVKATRSKMSGLPTRS
jgi:hypothetical protein